MPDVFPEWEKSEELSIEAQLKALGLNAKERSDFLNFWLPYMPSTPYVRLTWLGNQQLDKIAPMKISPRPDTVIRVFLDFAGLDSPISLQPQHFSPPARNGFTVVEWGGLMSGGLR